MNPMDRQVVLVTGGSRGIGRAIALRLAAKGATLVVNYRSEEAAAASVVARIEGVGGQAVAVQADVGRPDEAQRLVDGVLEQFGQLDVLVNNAGIQRSAMAHKMSDADWHDVIAVNLSAPFFLSRAALPAMRAAGRGHIVNIASASSFVAQPGVASYVASKHALIGLTKALALENAKKGVLVNAVAPGLTRTDMVSGLTEAQRAGLERLVPMGRLGEPAEVARLVEWLVTEGSYSTGNTFHVSGGVALG